MTESASPEQLTKQFGIDGVLRFDRGNGDLCRAIVTHPLASGEMYLHGAHVTAWQPEGHDPVLFVSRESWFEDGQTIRGGVPICFPWFGPKAHDPEAPMHGTARLEPWEVIRARQSDAGVAIYMSTRIENFRIGFEATLGTQLRMDFQVENVSGQSARFEEALHTYFKVGDIKQVQISGLENTEYLDKVQDMARCVQPNEPIGFTGETDRIYLGTQAMCVLDDPVMNRTIEVKKEHSNTTVVWNPWIDKAARLEAFGDDEWPGMVCIETCNVADYAVTLAPGGTHHLTATIGVEGR